jgi:hypothetical protein
VEAPSGSESRDDPLDQGRKGRPGSFAGFEHLFVGDRRVRDTGLLCWWLAWLRLCRADEAAYLVKIGRVPRLSYLAFVLLSRVRPTHILNNDANPAQGIGSNPTVNCEMDHLASLIDAKVFAPMRKAVEVEACLITKIGCLSVTKRA